MAFSGWPAEAVEFYRGLSADNTKAYWTARKPVYEATVHAPMAELLAELAGEFGPGRIARPNRDVRFSPDKSPYKTAIYATFEAGGYVKFSADGPPPARSRSPGRRTSRAHPGGTRLTTRGSACCATKGSSRGRTGRWLHGWARRRPSPGFRTSCTPPRRCRTGWTSRSARAQRARLPGEGEAGERSGRPVPAGPRQRPAGSAGLLIRTAHG